MYRTETIVNSIEPNSIFSKILLNSAVCVWERAWPENRSIEYGNPWWNGYSNSKDVYCNLCGPFTVIGKMVLITISHKWPFPIHIFNTSILFLFDGCENFLTRKKFVPYRFVGSIHQLNEHRKCEHKRKKVEVDNKRVVIDFWSTKADRFNRWKMYMTPKSAGQMKKKTRHEMRRIINKVNVRLSKIDQSLQSQKNKQLRSIVICV